jgi:hypothetical protein
MSNVEKRNIFSDGEDNSTVTNCKFLVVPINNNSIQQRWKSVVYSSDGGQWYREAMGVRGIEQ